MPNPRKIRVVNCEAFHLYSLQQLIVPEDIYVFHLVDLLTCLGHTYHSKLDWIQSTCLDIYTSLNGAKSDPTHPVWSIVNKRLTCKHPYFNTAVHCAWDNILS